MVAAGDRQDRRRPPAADGDRHLAGESQEPGALQGHLAPAGARRRPDRRRRRARSRRKARRSSGSTAACTRPKCSARSSSARWSTRWSAAPTTRRCGSSTTSSSSSCTRIRTATISSPTGTCGTPDPQQRTLERPAAALPEVHRPRQQPRLLRLDAGRDREHEPRALPRVVPADPLQPPPERPGRHGRLVAAAARSVQLQPRSARCPRHPGDRHRACTRGSPPRASRARRCDRAGRTTAGGTAASATPRPSTTSIAILTEMIGSPTPMRDSARAAAPDADRRSAVSRSRRRSGTSASRSTTRCRCNRAMLDFASRMRENLLFNIYVMGKHSIERGSTDTWTPNPHRRDAAQSPSSMRRSAQRRARRRGGRGGARRPSRTRRCGRRCTRPSIAIRAATSFRRTSRISRRRRSSSTRCSRPASRSSARRARSPSRARQYPAGSYVVFTAQAFRPHVMDMFEPQDHPDIFPYPGAPPTPPYDNAGWTLAFQMGVRVRSHSRRVHRAVRDDHGLERHAAAGQGRRDGRTPAATSRAIASTTRSSRVESPARRRTKRCCDSRRRSRSTARRSVGACTCAQGVDASSARSRSRRELGVNFDAATSRAAERRGQASRAARRPVGSVRRIDDAGWTRWILEQFEFPFDARLRAGSSTPAISTRSTTC